MMRRVKMPAAGEAQCVWRFQEALYAAIFERTLGSAYSGAQCRQWRYTVMIAYIGMNPLGCVIVQRFADNVSALEEVVGELADEGSTMPLDTALWAASHEFSARCDLP